MVTTQDLNGILFAEMIKAGAENLRAHAQEINDLNVFPIPDGDTGDNMLLTMLGGVTSEEYTCEKLCEAAREISSGMLLSARGNSGVILSQFFEGIAKGFSGLHTADTAAIGKAFRKGVEQAYRAVMTPTEGTILTVIREATEYACAQKPATPEAFLRAFLAEANASLARTPDLLPVLKKAGVVDSGAAGLICIVNGMMRAVLGEEIGTVVSPDLLRPQALNLDAFDENSILEFGYCTELLLRLQTCKTDLDAFDVKVISDYLKTIGDSIVTVRNGSIVKLHVHTMTPDKVLAFCQNYGEFLKIKIENMSLQHNSAESNAVKAEVKPARERKKYGIVAVANGDGLKQLFTERGADVIVDGGQSMNPSAEAFIEAFDAVNADTVFVFPNNGNIILTAKQAAGLYEGADVRVIESHTIGDGYVALAMFDTGSGNTDTIVSELNEAMQGVITAEISRCVRNATSDSTELHIGDYIGFVGKDLLAAGENRLKTVCETVDKLNFERYDICILICGKDATEEEANEVDKYIASHYEGKEVYIINGDQDIYDYIMIME